LTAAVGVSFLYQNRTKVSVDYTNFSGGDYNAAKDRDNVSLAASFTF
jgi:hypothetical protein